jgi:hypothetical protein
MAGEVAYMMMTLRDQVKIYHWQTMIYSRHIATNDLIPKLDTNIDQFIEVYIGKYGRPTFSGKTSHIPLRNFHDKDAPQLITEAIEWLTNVLPTKMKKSDTDLFSIRDVILADLNQVLYLFSFDK